MAILKDVKEIEYKFIDDCGTRCGFNEKCPIYKKKMELECPLYKKAKAEGIKLRLKDIKVVGVYEIMEK